MTAWYDRRTIDLGRDQFVSPFWHCFGVKDERVSLWQVTRMLLASRTWLLPINTAHGLTVGHDTSVTWERVRRHAIAASCVPCLNINLQTSAEAAVRLARDAFQQTGIDLLKLEVLTDDLTDSNDEAVLEATAELLDDGMRVMPLVRLQMNEAVLDSENVPAIRVMGSPIGSGLGIENPETIRNACELGKPVILDGGIGHARDIADAMACGCAGFLVNSMLFTDDDPAATLRDLRRDLLEFGIEPDTDEWASWWDRSRAVA